MNTETIDLATPHQQTPATFPSTSSKPPSGTRRVFVGPEGLRAGWGLLLFLASFALLMIVANRIGHKLHHAAGVAPQGTSLTSILVNASIPFFATLLISWMMSRIEGRPHSSYGLGGRHILPNFLAGLASGVTFLSLLVFTLIKTGLLVIDIRLLSGLATVRYGAPWLAGFLMIALFEEYLFRGYLLFTLMRGLTSIYRSLFHTRHAAALGFWSAALVLSLAFGMGHNGNAGESPIGLLSVTLASLVFCLSLWRTGSLWWAIGFHTTWDWAQSFVYGVADSGTMIRQHVLTTHPVGTPILSGGATGPEGSIYILVILALISITIVFTLPRRQVHTLISAV